MKKYLYLFSILVLFSCTSSNEEQASNEEMVDEKPTLTISQNNLSKQFGDCTSDTAVYCTRVTVVHPIFSGTSLSEKLNQGVKAQILEKYLKDSASSTLEAYADQFIEDYKTIKSKFDKAFGWYTDVNSRVVRQDSNLVVIESAVSIYTGGAHGTDELYYLNFDAESGKILSLEDILEPGFEESLNKLAQSRFEAKLSRESEFEAFKFENERFYNDNFGLLSNGLKFYYNAYEIAPYSSGATDIVIGYSQLGELLKEKYKK